MTGKVVVITGSNAGIGREAAVALARRGATVVITSRSELRGGPAREYVRRHSRAGDRIVLLDLDLASFASIEAFAAQVLDRFDRLDVLINNAGGVLSDRRETREGFEMTFGVNHLGHFYLTQLLLDRLLASAPARVITTASIAHRTGTMLWTDLERSGGYVGTDAYCQSKLANVLFTLELARQFDPAALTANCCHPGAVRSGFASAEDTRGFERFIVALGRPFMVSPRRGAKPLVVLAASPRFEGVSGGYWVGGYVPGVHRHRPSRQARDPEAGARLWSISEQYIEQTLRKGT
ncbi:MAG: SDR family oxidoreductase [Actinobacteria bacterium]|nr:SDR family oxidoreductase [Actinomycetota bacterium]